VSESIPAIVLGGTGYVAGELLRLIAGHPRLKLKAVLSDSQPGARVAAAFPHLSSAYPDLAFSGLEEVEGLLQAPRTALFCGPDRPAAHCRRAQPNSLRGHLSRLSLFQRGCL
jgi:N-acetyl-gamma-glutamylphosphate reductase